MKNRTPLRDKALQRAIDAMGTKGRNVVALAQALGVTTQAIAQWRRVPVDRVWDVERITGVPKEELRPDIYLPPIQKALAKKKAK